MRTSDEYPEEKSSHNKSRFKLHASGKKILSFLLALTAISTSIAILDSNTGFPFRRSPPTPGEITSWLTNDFPIILDEALMKIEMLGIEEDSNHDLCPQQPAFNPSASQVKVDIPSEDVLAERLSQAIQVDTSVGDNWPSPDEAPELWAPVFDPFKLYLEKTFPKCHEENGPISREIVNQHGLIYTFQGSDPKLKPLLLMAHQDVVPVNPAVESEWWSPPFIGEISQVNGTVWGRGSVDAKLWLVSIMSTLESLLESGFEPQRTILTSWGFDEESGGVHGAKTLAKRLEEIHGKDSLAMIVDEGNPVMSKSNPAGLGIPVAIPAVEEKGMLNVKIRVESAGGHSSAPPPHTSIGLLSRIVVELENNPDSPHIDLDSAQLKFLQCVRNSPAIPPKLRGALRDLDWAMRQKSRFSLSESLFSGDHRQRQRIDRAKRRVIDFLGPEFSVPFVTTRAVDIFNGGVKSNAIAEQAEAIVNHRIATHSSISELKEEYIRELKELAKELDLQFFAWGEEVKESRYSSVRSHSVFYDDKGKAHHVSPPINRKRRRPFIGKLFVEEWSEGLEPAPKTPISSDLNEEDSKAWRLFSSVIRNVWRVDKDGEGVDDEETDAEGILVAPSLMQGNTDTQRYWNFTRNIFRFGPSSLKQDLTGLGAFKGVHTTNEHAIIDGITQSVRFYTQLIQAVDESDL